MWVITAPLEEWSCLLGAFWLFSGSPCYHHPPPDLSLGPSEQIPAYSAGGISHRGAPEQGLGLFGFYQPLLDQTAVELLDVRVHALPVRLSKPHHVLCVQELRAVRMGPGEGRGPGRGREAGPRRGKGGRGREEKGENTDTHIHIHTETRVQLRSQCCSLPAPPHAPFPWWTCRSLPITNGVQCRQGWGARPVIGAENSWVKRERGGGQWRWH